MPAFLCIAGHCFVSISTVACWTWEETVKFGFNYILIAAFMYTALSTEHYADNACFEFQVTNQTVDIALGVIAQQTKTPLLLPYDQIKTIKANDVKGCYTLKHALDLALNKTGLTATISEQGVITVKFIKVDKNYLLRGKT
jgi:hypothetical protein